MIVVAPDVIGRESRSGEFCEAAAHGLDNPPAAEHRPRAMAPCMIG